MFSIELIGNFGVSYGVPSGSQKDDMRLGEGSLALAGPMSRIEVPC